MKLARKKAVEIHNMLSGFKGTYNKTFSMYLILNTKKLKPVIQEIQDIQESSKPSGKFLELQQQELALVNEYVDKDKNGNPITVGENGFKIRENDIDIYNSKKNALMDDNKDIIDEFEALKDNVDKLVNEEVEVDFILIPFDCIPEEIGVTELEVLSTIVEDFGKI